MQTARLPSTHCGIAALQQVFSLVENPVFSPFFSLASGRLQVHFRRQVEYSQMLSTPCQNIDNIHAE